MVFYLIVSPFVARRVNHVESMNPMNPDENFQAQLPLLFLRFVLQPARLLAAVVPHPRVMYGRKDGCTMMYSIIIT